jgi:hypothetical protein
VLIINEFKTENPFSIKPYKVKNTEGVVLLWARGGYQIAFNFTLLIIASRA